jgi:hypothetical protein
MAKAEWQATTRFIEQALEVLEREEPMTIRQLFYRLVSARVIENTLSGYRRVSWTLTKIRKDGRCPFDWIVDRSRPEYTPSVWEDAKEYLTMCKVGYRKDYWHDQPKYVEVWVEKDAIVGAIEPVTDELGVPIRVGRGFLSTTRVAEIAKMLARVGKGKHIFYLGDHDPSGQCIEQEVKGRILSLGSKPFKLVRLAIHPEDITKFDLPPLRVKDSDSRTAKFTAKYGSECVELDALPPAELRRRLRAAIEALLDVEKWDRAALVEKVESASIMRFMEQFANDRTRRL